MSYINTVQDAKDDVNVYEAITNKFPEPKKINEGNGLAGAFVNSENEVTRVGVGNRYGNVYSDAIFNNDVTTVNGVRGAKLQTALVGVDGNTPIGNGVSVGGGIAKALDDSGTTTQKANISLADILGSGVQGNGFVQNVDNANYHGNTVGANVRYRPTDDIGLAATLSKTSSNYGDTTALSAQARWQATKDLALMAKYQQMKGAQEGSGWNVGGTYNLGNNMFAYGGAGQQNGRPSYMLGVDKKF